MPEDLYPHLLPRQRRVRISLMLCQPAIELSRELGRDRERLIGRIVGDRVPEVLHQLPAFGDTQPPERLEIERRARHIMKSRIDEGRG